LFGLEGYDSGSQSDALITTRDGTVGPWPAALPPAPAPLNAEAKAVLELWEPRVRAAIFDFEACSRLAFSFRGANSQVSVWHAKTTSPAAAGAAPTASYLPLVRFDRPGVAVFTKQLELMEAYADIRPDRAVEIFEQLSSPVAFLASVEWLRADTRRWTMELIDLAIRLSRFVQYRVKHALACRRPIEYAPRVQPMILTPGHGALPSGHASEAFTAATVLLRLLRETGLNPYTDSSYAEHLARIAARIAINRTVAGVHFPIDSVAGAMLGVTLGNYLVARMKAAAGVKYKAAHFDGTAGSIDDRDFLWTEVFDINTAGVVFGTHPALKAFPDSGGTDQFDPEDNAASEPLKWLWDKAVAEWKIT
jgi:membrane-associated phospholipid phosphatase